jgi:photosystem II stability/assembly factor-like uncharacterized protein
VRVVARTVAGSYAVDLETGEVEPASEPAEAAAPELGLPRVVAAAAAGSTVIAVVDAKPPLLVSHDAGTTWSESGRGLPPGRAVAIADDDPDVAVYAARNRLYVTRDGGRFWEALDAELPEIESIGIDA